jgi:hypothetical protein
VLRNLPVRQTSPPFKSLPFWRAQQFGISNFVAHEIRLRLSGVEAMAEAEATDRIPARRVGVKRILEA